MSQDASILSIARDKPAFHNLANQWVRAYTEIFQQIPLCGFNELKPTHKSRVISRLNKMKADKEKEQKRIDAEQEKALKVQASKVNRELYLTSSKLPSIDKEITYPFLNAYSEPANTIENLNHLMSSMGITAASNDMTLDLEILSGDKPLDLTFDQKRSMLISEAEKTGLQKASIDDHLTSLCHSRTYHPVRAWLHGNEWDGVKRVNDVIKTLNAKNEKIAKLIISKWLVAAIGAIYEDSFSCKLVPVLQGEQSYMKTAFISRIANVVPNAFLEGAELNPDNKDSVSQVIKSWITELGELERTSRNSQGSIKAFITRRIDTIRLPYARSETKKKRQTVFVATVNGNDFLRDETGSSRYGVIELASKVDIEKLNELLGYTYNNGRLSLASDERLKQFWLEVKHHYDSGASWVLSPEEELALAAINKPYEFKNDIRYLLEDYLSTRSNEIFKWMSSAEACTHLDLRSTDARKVGKALTLMAQEGLIDEKLGRSRTKLYYLPHSIRQKTDD